MCKTHENVIPSGNESPALGPDIATVEDKRESRERTMILEVK